MYPRHMGAVSPTQPPVAQRPVDLGMAYSIGIEQLALAAGASAQPQVQITDHDFEVHLITAVSTGAFTCRLRIGDRYLSNVPIHSSNLFGTGANPMPLLSPILIPKGTIVIAELLDLSGAPNDIRIGMLGLQKN